MAAGLHYGVAVDGSTTTIESSSLHLTETCNPPSFQAAVGPTNNNDDFTNLNFNAGISGVAPGGTTTAQGVVIFKNTIQNTGNATDTYTLTATSVPVGFTVELSPDGVSGLSPSTVRPSEYRLLRQRTFGCESPSLRAIWYSRHTQ